MKARKQVGSILKNKNCRILTYAFEEHIRKASIKQHYKKKKKS